MHSNHPTRGELSKVPEQTTKFIEQQLIYPTKGRRCHDFLVLYLRRILPAKNILHFLRFHPVFPCRRYRLDQSREIAFCSWL